jgi:hypothetical protein
VEHGRGCGWSRTTATTIPTCTVPGPPTTARVTSFVADGGCVDALAALGTGHCPSLCYSPASSPAPAVPSAATATAALDSITEPEPAPPPTRPLLATDTFSPLESNTTTAATPAPGAAVPATTTAPADAADVPGEGDASGAAAKGAGATDAKSQQAVRPPLRRKDTFTGPQEEAKLEARALIRQSVDLDKDLVDLSNLWYVPIYRVPCTLYPVRMVPPPFVHAIDFDTRHALVMSLRLHYTPYPPITLPGSRAPSCSRRARRGGRSTSSRVLSTSAFHF